MCVCVCVCGVSVCLSVEVASSFALVGIDRLEKNFPFLNQTTDEVCSSSSLIFQIKLESLLE